MLFKTIIVLLFIGVVASLFGGLNFLVKDLGSSKKRLLKLLWLRVIFATLLLLTIFIGSLLLSLPISSTGVTSLAFIDALFTSFSAVCVTGLTVNSVGEEFSFFGQIIILLLIQIGGLGIMSFSILTLLLMKQKVSPQQDHLYL